MQSPALLFNIVTVGSRASEHITFLSRGLGTREQNALMAIATNDVIVELENFLQQIDFPTPQILIEALVVDFNSSDISNLGIIMGTNKTTSDSTGWSNFSFLDVGINEQGNFYTQHDGNSVNEQISNFSNWIGAKNIGVLPDNFYVKIQALESEGKANVLSRPQIATLNGHTGSITIGTTRAISITVIILFCIYLSNLILPTYRNWTSLNNNISLQKEQIAQGRDWQSTILKLDNESKRLEEKFETFVNKKDGLGSLTEILQLLNNIANMNDISIDSIRPGEELDFPSYKQRELFLKIKGNHNSIGSFFAELEEGSSSILIKSSKLYSEETGLKAEVQLRIISMKEEL